MTTAFQNQACLPLEKRDIVFAHIFFFAFVVEKFMNDLATKNGFFKMDSQSSSVTFVYMSPCGSTRTRGSDFTESVAARFS